MGKVNYVPAPNFPELLGYGEHINVIYGHAFLIHEGNIMESSKE